MVSAGAQTCAKGARRLLPRYPPREPRQRSLGLGGRIWLSVFTLCRDEPWFASSTTPLPNPVLRADISILPVETLSSLYTPTWLGLGDFVKRGFSQSQGQTDQKPEDTAPPPPPEPCDVRPDLRLFSELFPDLLGKGSGARVTRRIVPVGM